MRSLPSHCPRDARAETTEVVSWGEFGLDHCRLLGKLEPTRTRSKRSGRDYRYNFAKAGCPWHSTSRHSLAMLRNRCGGGGCGERGEDDGADSN